MKAVVLVLSLAVMAYAQGDRVQVVEQPDRVHVVNQPGGSNVIDPAFYRPTNPQPPFVHQGVQQPSIEPAFVIPNPDPFFSQPHGNNIIDPGYYMPHAPGGNEPINIGPTYVDGSQYGGLRPTRPGQQNKYPPYARGGN